MHSISLLFFPTPWSSAPHCLASIVTSILFFENKSDYNQNLLKETNLEVDTIEGGNQLVMEAEVIPMAVLDTAWKETWRVLWVCSGFLLCPSHAEGESITSCHFHNGGHHLYPLFQPWGFFFSATEHCSHWAAPSPINLPQWFHP